MYSLCVHSVLTYGPDIRVMKAENQYSLDSKESRAHDGRVNV